MERYAEEMIGIKELKLFNDNIKLYDYEFENNF